MLYLQANQNPSPSILMIQEVAKVCRKSFETTYERCTEELNNFHKKCLLMTFEEFHEKCITSPNLLIDA
jgi:hypothetical protein